MGQPTPPGDSPLYEGLSAEWNDVISGFPEDRRGELAPLLKSKIDAYEPLKQWEQFQKSGVTADHADTALKIYSTIENNPREVYEALGKHLGISTAEAKEVVQEINDDDSGDPEMAALRQQVETMGQILLAQRQTESQAAQAAAADKEIENEIAAVKKKYGTDVDEQEIVMRMLHLNMTAEQAHQDYSSKVSEIRKRPAAPFVMGPGGAIPAKAIDVKKLSGQDTKSLVAQMMQQSNAERNA